LSNHSKSILSLAKLESDKHEDPLQVFFSGIKSSETKNAYKKTFREFLDSVEDFEGTFEEKTLEQENIKDDELVKKILALALEQKEY